MLKNKQLDFIGFLGATGEVIFTTGERDIFNNPDSVDLDNDKKLITISRGDKIIYLSELENELLDGVKRDGGFTLLVLDDGGGLLFKYRYGSEHNSNLLHVNSLDYIG